MPSCIGISFEDLIAYLFSILITEEICLASRPPKLEKFGFSIALCYQSDNWGRTQKNPVIKRNIHQNRAFLGLKGSSLMQKYNR